ncbi:hypothetical protein NDU88_005972 [Pleurodeles waltl]|uniref:Uncharacterized protein n=1 Tax=Pleurodeles waltl TaxID=8319 RepID=A0AAV7PP94_PLEWA|nr:hypothetical protein NDU88_005972 [Pleurodeles waltl]
MSQPAQPVRGPAPCLVRGVSASPRPRHPFRRTTMRHVCRDPRDRRRRGWDEILRLRYSNAMTQRHFSGRSSGRT